MKTYIGRLTDKKSIVRGLQSLTMALLLMMFSSCASYDHEEQHEPAVLKIYVFAPDRPIVTRADINNPDVNATAEENAIHSLSVWVFEHSDGANDGKKVGYVNTTGEQLSTGQAVLTMDVSDDFATNQPNVDVYVMANVTNGNCGLSLGATSTRSELDNALIKSSYFGLSSLVTSSVISAEGYPGLPMSGVLKNQTIFGDAPVFGVGSKTTKTLTNVKLVRAVSKVQFVFTAIKDIDKNTKHTVKSITLDASQDATETTDAIGLPTSEYLFLDDAYSADGGGDPLTYSGYRYKVGGSYNDAIATLFTSTDGQDINVCNPERGADYYVYKTQTGQDYESLIQSGIDNGDLTSVGTYYLRESDRIISGTITYDGDKTATFSLKDAGDFGRNHTWIVYGYFTEELGIMTLSIKVKAWKDDDPLEHYIYNW